ncbi:MAG: ROK family protein, partial [Candidatus Omnitrophota bacterium]
MGLRLDGRLYYEYLTDKLPLLELERPGNYYEMKIAFDAHELPLKSTILDNWRNKFTDFSHLRWFGQSRMTGRVINYTVIIFPDKPGYSIFSNNSSGGLIDQANDFIRGKEGIYNDSYRLLHALEGQDPQSVLKLGLVRTDESKEYTFERNAKLFFQGEELTEKTDRYLTQPKAVVGKDKAYRELTYGEGLIETIKDHNITKNIKVKDAWKGIVGSFITAFTILGLILFSMLAVLIINKFLNKLIVVRQQSLSQNIPEAGVAAPALQADMKWLHVITTLGQLSYRQRLVEDILQRTNNLAYNDPIFIRIVDVIATFWGTILAKQSGQGFMQGKLGLRRNNAISVKEAKFLITEGHLDALFEFCREDNTDPLTLLNLNNEINNWINHNEIPVADVANATAQLMDQRLLSEIKDYLKKKFKAKGLPFIEFPVSIWKAYALAFVKAPLIILNAHKQGAQAGVVHHAPLKSRFWKWNLTLWALFNLPIWILLGIFWPVTIPWWGIALCFIPFLLNIPLVLMSSSQANYGAMAAIIADKEKLAEVRHWNRAIFIAKRMLNTGDKWLRFVWNSIVDDLRNGDKGPLVSKAVWESLRIPEDLAGQSFVNWLNTWNPIKPELREAQLRIIKHMNRALMDRPKVENENDVPPAIIQSSCFGEKFRVRFKPSAGINELDMIDKNITNGDQMYSQWQMLMRKHLYEWQLEIELIIGNKLPKSHRKKLIGGKISAKETVDLLLGYARDNTAEGESRLTRGEIELLIEDWANWRLENVYKTIESARLAQLWSYKIRAAKFIARVEGESLEHYNARLESWARERIYFIWLYDTFDPNTTDSNSNSAAIKEYLARFASPLWTNVSYGSNIYQTWLVSGNAPHYILVHGFSKRKVYPSKAGAWSDVLPILKTIADIASTDAFLAIDVGHRINNEDWLYLPEFFREFVLDPGLGLIGVPYEIYGTEYSLVIKGLNVGESTFNTQVGRTQARIAMEHGYGKMGLRISAMIKSSAVITAAVCEDTMIGIQMRKAGYHTKHIEYLLIIQSAEKTFYDAAAFLCRFPAPVTGDTLFLTPEFWLFLADPAIAWEDKVGTLYNFMFYLRKPIIVATNVATIMLTTVFPFNIFAWLFLPWLFIYNGTIASQSINFNSLQMFNEKPKERLLWIIPIPAGDSKLAIWIRKAMYTTQGTLEFILYFPLLFFLYVAYIFNYAYKVVREGFTRVGLFTLSLRQSDLRRKSMMDIYRNFPFAVKLGTFLLWLYIISPFHPVGWAINLFILFMPVVTVTAPFFLNIAKNPLHWLVSGLMGSIYGFVRATIDLPVSVILWSIKLALRIISRNKQVNNKPVDYVFNFEKKIEKIVNIIETGTADRRGNRGVRGIIYPIEKFIASALGIGWGIISYIPNKAIVELRWMAYQKTLSEENFDTAFSAESREVLEADPEGRRITSGIVKKPHGAEETLAEGSQQRIQEYLIANGLDAENTNLVSALNKISNLSRSYMNYLEHIEALVKQGDFALAKALSQQGYSIDFGIKLVENSSRYSYFTDNTFVIDIELLRNRSLLELEILEAVYRADREKGHIRAPPEIEDEYLALWEVISDFLKATYFHSLPAHEQAQILVTLLKEGNDLDKFHQIFVKTYPTRTKFELLLAMLREILDEEYAKGKIRTSPEDIINVLSDLQLSGRKERDEKFAERSRYLAKDIATLIDFHIFRLVFEYKLTQEHGTESLKECLNHFVTENYLLNYIIFCNIYGKDDIKAINKLLAEAINTNRPLHEIITGIVHPDHKVNPPYNKLPANGIRAPPALYLYVGGAGKRATDFACGLIKRHASEQDFSNLDKLVIFSVCSISDEGGHIRKLEDALLTSDGFWWYPLPTGDIPVYPVKFALNKFKKELLTERRITSFSCENAVYQNIVDIMQDGDNFPAEELPVDLHFFLANNLSMARLIDSEFVSKGIITIDRASWQNLFYVIARLITGQIKRGEITADTSKSLSLIYEMLGSKPGYAEPVSYTASPQAAILEGFAIGINNMGVISYVTIAKDENNNYYYLNPKPNSAGILRPQPVIGNESAVRITEQPITINLNDIQMALSLATDNSQIAIKVTIQNLDFIFSEEEEYRTRATSNDKQIVLRADSFWHELLPLGEGLSFVAKSRLVEGQDKITDAAEYHPAVIQRFIFNGLKRQKDQLGRDMVVFVDVDEEISDRFESVFGRSNDRAYVPISEYPEVNPQVLAGIENCFGAILIGDSSVGTSVSAALMMRKFTEAIAQRKDIPRIYIFKIMQDIETAGLGLEQQIELLERSIQESVNPNFRFDSSFCSHIVLPDLEVLFRNRPDIKEKFDKQRKEAEDYYNSPQMQEAFAKGEKRSKFIPEHPVEITDKQAIEEYFRNRSIRVIWTADLNDPSKAKFTYRQDALIRLIEGIKDSYSTGFSSEARNEVVYREEVGNFATNLNIADLSFDLRSIFEIFQKKADIVMARINRIMRQVGRLENYQDHRIIHQLVEFIDEAKDSQQALRRRQYFPRENWRIDSPYELTVWISRDVLENIDLIRDTEIRDLVIDAMVLEACMHFLPGYNAFDMLFDRSTWQRSEAGLNRIREELNAIAQGRTQEGYIDILRNLGVSFADIRLAFLPFQTDLVIDAEHKIGHPINWPEFLTNFSRRGLVEDAKPARNIIETLAVEFFYNICYTWPNRPATEQEFRTAFKERFHRYYQYNFWLDLPAYELGFEQGRTYRELVEEKAVELFRVENSGFVSVAQWRKGIEDMMTKKERHIKITLTFENRFKRFSNTLTIPELSILSEEGKDDVLTYVGRFIYSGFNFIVADRIIIDAEQDVFIAIKEKFDSLFNWQETADGKPDMLRRATGLSRDMYGTPLEILHSSSLTGERQISSRQLVLPEQPDQDARIIAIDLGGTGIKGIALKGAQMITSHIQPWKPGDFKDPQRHVRIIESIIEALIQESGFDRIDAVGISWASPVVDDYIKLQAAIGFGINRDQFVNVISPIKNRLEQDLGVPVAILNDGEAAAYKLAADARAKGEDIKNTLYLILGTAMASAYFEQEAKLDINLVHELGNVVIDVSDNATAHGFTKIMGAAQQYVSQAGLVKAAEIMGITFPASVPATDRAKFVGMLLLKPEEVVKEYALSGNPLDWQQKALAAHRLVARYIAALIAELRKVLPVEKVKISGGVTLSGGDIFVQEALNILADGRTKIERPTKDLQLIRFAGAMGAGYYAYAKTKAEDRLSGYVSKPIAYSPRFGIIANLKGISLIEELLRRGIEVILINDATNKVSTVEHFLTTNNILPEELIYLGNNFSAQGDDAIVVGTLSNVHYLAVDDDQDAVISAEGLTKAGSGVQATAKLLRAIIDNFDMLNQQGKVNALVYLTKWSITNKTTTKASSDTAFSAEARGADKNLKLLAEGSLEDIVGYLLKSSKAEDRVRARNLEVAFSKVIKIAERFYPGTDLKPRMRLSRDITLPEDFQQEFFVVSYNELISEPLVRNILIGQLDYIALRPQGPEEKAKAIIFGLFRRIENFHGNPFAAGLSISEQAEYISVVIGNVVLDRHGFYKYFLRTYKDKGNFSKLIGLLQRSYKFKDQTIEELLQVYSHRKEVIDSCLEYARRKGICSNAIRNHLLSTKEYTERSSQASRDNEARRIVDEVSGGDYIASFYSLTQTVAAENDKALVIPGKDRLDANCLVRGVTFDLGNKDGWSVLCGLAQEIDRSIHMVSPRRVANEFRGAKFIFNLLYFFTELLRSFYNRNRADRPQEQLHLKNFYIDAYKTPQEEERLSLYNKAFFGLDKSGKMVFGRRRLLGGKLIINTSEIISWQKADINPSNLGGKDIAVFTPMYVLDRDARVDPEVDFNSFEIPVGSEDRYSLIVIDNKIIKIIKGN